MPDLCDILWKPINKNSNFYQNGKFCFVVKRFEPLALQSVAKVPPLVKGRNSTSQRLGKRWKCLRFRQIYSKATRKSMLPSFTTFKHHHLFDTTSAHADVFLTFLLYSSNRFVAISPTPFRKFGRKHATIDSRYAKTTLFACKVFAMCQHLRYEVSVLWI